ncbi:MAG: chemotaxis response regulator protein-glutamate methylesterase [Melioribacteraceae bacterium]|nr:chemotaxis response regulator protein-glutamate methylesterase [Melioribacteraceae bacterium]
MLNSKIKVIIVDDSAFMRKSLSIMLESDDSIEIIAAAKDGLEGYELIKKLRPDIVTLDIEMPRMDGLTALKKIMTDCPTPVLMVSSLTTEGAESTIKAMEYGAIDFIPKELSYVNVNIIKIKDDLIKKIKAIVQHKRSLERLERLKRIQSPKVAGTILHSNTIPVSDYRAVALGISTGGPLSLQKVIPSISENINVPVFVVQHMPPKFTRSLADRLDNLSKLKVKEAEDEETVEKNTVYIAPGGFHMMVKTNQKNIPVIKIAERPIDTLHKPSVDVMMNSVVEIYGKKTLAIIMTGMGKDGLEAMKKLKSLGGTCIAQDERTSIVYGMPKAIVDAGIADAVLGLEQISENINKVFSNERRILRTSLQGT